VRVYLDVCCLNRPFDDQSQERVRLEAEAVLAILRRIEAGVWELVGSEVVDYEIRRQLDLERRRRVLALARLAADNVTLDRAIRTRTAELAACGLTPLDALHVACAETAGVDVFLTTDDRLLRVLRRTENLRVSANNPLPWVNEVLT
jgi:predicted nucleic acid-binding protein